MFSRILDRKNSEHRAVQNQVQYDKCIYIDISVVTAHRIGEIKMIFLFSGGLI